MCSKDGARVETHDIVRGYALEKERYVVVTDEELQALEPRRTRDIELTRFVDASSIPPSYFERAYFLAPGSESMRAYHLLASTMDRMGKVGLANFVMRGKQHLVAIFSQGGVLLAETMRFAEEVRSPEEAGWTGAQPVPASSVTRFGRLIRQHNASKLDLAELGDDYWERMHTLVHQKLAKGKDVVSAPEADSAVSERPASNVIDIMEALKRRLAGQTEDVPERSSRSRPRSSPRRRAKTSASAAKKTSSGSTAKSKTSARRKAHSRG